MAPTNLFRLVHPKHYSFEKARFKSPAFEASSDGASVIDMDCACGAGSSPCSHIAHHYRSSISGDPAVFIRFRAGDLPAGSDVRNDETLGDKCHYLINGPNKTWYRNFLASKSIEEFEICEGGEPRPLSLTDIYLQRPDAPVSANLDPGR